MASLPLSPRNLYSPLVSGPNVIIARSQAPSPDPANTQDGHFSLPIPLPGHGPAVFRRIRLLRNRPMLHRRRMSEANGRLL